MQSCGKLTPDLGGWGCWRSTSYTRTDRSRYTDPRCDQPAINQNDRVEESCWMAVPVPIGPTPKRKSRSRQAKGISLVCARRQNSSSTGRVSIHRFQQVRRPGDASDWFSRHRHFLTLRLLSFAAARRRNTSGWRNPNDAQQAGQ